ncbi:hypothetical protein RIF29_04716 [Crotalaria pallida]|uniref:Uncharacterized protein n=1 Tax=Crotalaria pallida TaxID=3830 RepID=A0AAN9P9D8_CROPI
MSKLSQRNIDDIEIIDVEDPVPERVEVHAEDPLEDIVVDHDDCVAGEYPVADIVADHGDHVTDIGADPVTDIGADPVQVADPVTDICADPVQVDEDANTDTTAGTDDSEDSEYNVLKDPHQSDSDENTDVTTNVEGGTDSDNDSVRSVFFDDSEEDRNLDLDDGFEFDRGLIPEGVQITYADAPASQLTPPNQDERILSMMREQQSNDAGAGNGSQTEPAATVGADAAPAGTGNGSQAEAAATVGADPALSGAANGSQAEPHAPAGAGNETQTEHIAKRRKANKKGIASSETVLSSQPITRSKVRKEITRGVTKSQPVTRSKRRLLYKDSSSRHPAFNDENMAQLVSDYMSMMETWKKEGKKKGLKIVEGEDKNKGEGPKKGGKKK